MNLRVAICISGQMRNFENRLDSLKSNLLDKYNCDIFIHTWKERGVTTDLNRLFPNGMQDYFQNDINSNPDDFIREWNQVLPYVDLNSNEITEVYLRQLYPNVKSVEIEETPKDYEEKKTLYGIKYPEFLLKEFPRRYHNLAMFYKIKSCNDLKINYELENDFKYDFVIRIRPDIHLKEELSFDLHRDNVGNSIFCKSGMKSEDYIFDQFFFGNSYSMDKVSTIWDCLSWYWDENNKDFDSSEKRTIGYLLHHHSIKNSIKINNIDIKTTLLEKPEEGKVDFLSFIPMLEKYIKLNGMNHKISCAISAAISQHAFHQFKLKSIDDMYKELQKVYIIAGYYFTNPPYGLALYYFEKKDFEKCSNFFEVAVLLEPNNEKIMKSYSKLLFEQKKYNELFVLLESKNLYSEILFYSCRAKMHEKVVEIYSNVSEDIELTDNLKYMVSLSFYFFKKYNQTLDILKDIENAKNKNLCSNVNYKISQIYFYKKYLEKSIEHIDIAINNSRDPAGLILFKSKILGKTSPSFEYLLNNKKYFSSKMHIFYYRMYELSGNNIEMSYYYLVKVHEIDPEYRDVSKVKTDLDEKLSLLYNKLDA